MRLVAVFSIEVAVQNTLVYVWTHKTMIANNDSQLSLALLAAFSAFINMSINILYYKNYTSKERYVLFTTADNEYPEQHGRSYTLTRRTIINRSVQYAVTVQQVYY